MLLLPTLMQKTVHWNLPELCRRSIPVPQIAIFIFPAFTLNYFFSIASFQVKSLLTIPQVIQQWYKGHQHRDPTGNPRAELAWQGLKHNDEEQWAEYWVLVNIDLLYKLFTVPLTNTDMAQCIGIIACIPWNSSTVHSSTPFSQLPPDDLPRRLIKCLLQVYESHVESLVGS